MAIEIRKAERKQAKLRIGLAGPSGAGKTMSALKLAHGIAPNGKIVLIDTERSSGDLYSHLFPYDIIDLQPPYAPKNYVEAIELAQNAGYDVIIIDSLSHAWSDEGGLLDQADKLSSKANSYTVWKDLTPQHRSLVNAMLNSNADIIATVRSKQAYEMEEYTDQRGNKKQKPVKLGMAPVQREGMEYEFTVFMDIEINHNAHTSKDRTDLFKDEVFVIDEKIGSRLLEWRGTGKAIDPSTTELKKKVGVELSRLGIVLPSKTEDATKYLQDSINRLTTLDWSPENLLQILATLKTLTPERAKELMSTEPAEPVVPVEKEQPVIVYPEDDIPFGTCTHCGADVDGEHKSDCRLFASQK